MTEPSSPTFTAIWRAGHESASAHDLDAGFLLVVCVRIFFSPSLARKSATPPPGRMPSSTAARVVHRVVDVIL